VIVYLDTSSLAKLYIEEQGTPDVRALVERARIVTSDVAYPEMRAALARRHHDRSLSRARFQAAKRTFEADWNSYLAVSATPTLCREAGVLAERHRLRGFDSIHLASFVEILRSGGANVEFSSDDTALNRTAATVQRALRASSRAAGR
jgi:predicted nucleic acid-binding protein